MATMSTTGNGWTIDVHQEMVDITSAYPSPDKSWRFTDAAGHEHYYGPGYPTLDLIIDAEHWCDGYEGIADHDPHMVVDESHYECVECREVIEPKMLPPYTPNHMPGMTSATLRGTRSDGVTITAVVTMDEVAQFRANIDDAQAFIDSIDEQRIVEWSTSR